MSEAPPVRITVKSRTWRDKKSGVNEKAILIYMGNVFVRIPITQAYKVSNQIVDLAEQHDAETRKDQHNDHRA